MTRGSTTEAAAAISVGDVQPVVREDMPRLVEVWEASVRATHDFLEEDDLRLFKGIVRDNLFGSVDLFCVRDTSNALVAFLGVSGESLEALFVDPAWRGHGIGRRLVRFAVDERGAAAVDVNEQNEQAVNFYRRMGFVTVRRSDLDPLGKPYPMLHMRLAVAHTG